MHESSDRAPRWPILLWLALALLATLQVVRNSYTADLGAFLPRSADRQQTVLMEQLRSGAAARLVLIGIDGGAAEPRAQASRALAEALRSSGLFEQVANGEGEDWQAVGRWVFERRYRLSPSIEAERFTPQGLATAIDETVSLMGTPGMDWLRNVVAQDPTGESLRLLDDLLPVRAPKTEHGVWMSRQLPRAVIMTSLAVDPQDLDAQEAALQHIRSAFDRVVAQQSESMSSLTLQVSGAPVFAVDSRSRIRGEVEWLTLAGSALAGLLLLVAFGSLLAIGVSALPVLTGVLMGVAAVGLVFGSVHGVTLAFGTTLIGESIDYGIYYLVQARRHAQDGNSGAWRRWLSDGWPAIRLGVLTSICGFAALVFSGFPGLQQLGVFSLIGLVAAAVTTRWILPCFMPNGSAAEGWRRPLARTGRWCVQRLPRVRIPALVLVGLSAVAVAIKPSLWDSELSSLSPVPPHLLALDESLRDDLGASDAAMIVVVRAPELQAVLERTEEVTARLTTLVEDGTLGGYDAITRFLPSNRTQQQRMQALPDAPSLQRALAQATIDGPLAASRLQPFLTAVQTAREQPMIQLSDLNDSPLKPLVRALLITLPDGSMAAQISLRLRLDGSAPDAQQVQRSLQDIPDVRVLEIGRELRELYRRYLREAMTQSALGALAVLALLAFSLRRIRRWVAVVLPLVGAALLVLGLMAAIDQRLGILHLVGLLLVVAIGSNYALFFSLSGEDGPLDDDKLSSLLLANLTTVLSFGLLAGSELPALSALGLVVAPGAFLALLLSAVFAPDRVQPHAKGSPP